MWFVNDWKILSTVNNNTCILRIFIFVERLHRFNVELELLSTLLQDTYLKFTNEKKRCLPAEYTLLIRRSPDFKFEEVLITE